MYKIFWFGLFLIIAQYGAQAQNGSYEYRGDEYYSYDEELNLYLEADYESRRGDKSDYRYRLLKVYTNTDNGLSEIQSHTLGGDDSELVSFRFDAEFNSYLRKFVILRGTKSFYVYDLKQRSIYGPFIPNFWGTSDEEDKGHITRLKIAEDGKSVYGITARNGCFYIEMEKFEQARELLPANIPFFSFNRVYAVPSADNPEVFDILFLSEEQGEVLFEHLFTETSILPDDRSFLRNISEDEKERRIMSATAEENRYTIFKEKSGAGYKVVDVFMGKTVELPADRQFSDESEVYEFLSQE